MVNFFNSLAKQTSIHFFLLLSIFFTEHALNLAKALQQCYEKNMSSLSLYAVNTVTSLT